MVMTTIYNCDVCKKENIPRKDVYSIEGSDLEFKGKNGTWIIDVPNIHHYCSIDCMFEHIKREMKEEQV